MEEPNKLRKLAKCLYRKLTSGTQAQQLEKLQKMVALLLAKKSGGQLEWFRNIGLLPDSDADVCDRCGIAHVRPVEHDTRVVLSFCPPCAVITEEE